MSCDALDARALVREQLRAKYTEAKALFYSLRDDVFTDKEIICAKEWREVCRSGVSSDVDKLLELSRLKLRMLHAYYDLQLVLQPDYFAQYTAEWIYLVDCTLHDNMLSYASEDDAFEAGCEIGGFPTGVFTAKVMAHNLDENIRMLNFF